MFDRRDEPSNCSKSYRKDLRLLHSPSPVRLPLGGLAKRQQEQVEDFFNNVSNISCISCSHLSLVSPFFRISAGVTDF